jgi:hypothetical protein
MNVVVIFIISRVLLKVESGLFSGFSSARVIEDTRMMKIMK